MSKQGDFYPGAISWGEYFNEEKDQMAAETIYKRDRLSAMNKLEAYGSGDVVLCRYEVDALIAYIADLQGVPLKNRDENTIIKRLESELEEALADLAALDEDYDMLNGLLEDAEKGLLRAGAKPGEKGVERTFVTRAGEEKTALIFTA